MSCDLCGGREFWPITNTPDARCSTCGHKQRWEPVPPGEQPIRGARRRGDDLELLNAAAGEIEALEPKPEGRY